MICLLDTALLITKSCVNKSLNVMLSSTVYRKDIIMPSLWTMNDGLPSNVMVSATPPSPLSLYFLKKISFNQGAMSEIHALHSCASDCTVRLHSVILHMSTEESEATLHAWTHATLVLYNEGVDLHHLMSSRSLPRNARLDLFLQLTSAVIFLHEEISFCHRDLKVCFTL